jgi:Ca2+-binding RTX toxin-like protein
LGGAAASAFSITSQANVGTILAGPAGVSGAANGKLYSLSASAVDTTTGVTGAASQVAVVIGAGAGDTIAVGAVLGTSPAPAFIFGLAGNDTINASGVASKLWIDGGAGADTMTGGTGGTTYLYGGAAESVASAMDVITNFDVTRDLIDLRALGGTLNVAGQVGTSGKLGGNTIAWQQSGTIPSSMSMPATSPRPSGLPI